MTILLPLPKFLSTASRLFKKKTNGAIPVGTAPFLFIMIVELLFDLFFNVAAELADINALLLHGIAVTNGNCVVVE